MPEQTREEVDVTAALKNILDSYPAGSATLREILQNTDDAGGQKQTFILDTRTFGSTSLVGRELHVCQGPAIIATNNAYFETKDWKAIRTILSSSKTEDENSTGKYGIGFRSCYHVTDNPHVLSHDKLLILDPHARVETFQGGFTLDTKRRQNKDGQIEREVYSDHFATFNAVFGPDQEVYPGTAIRLPLRLPGYKSNLKPTPTDVADVRKMFNDFIEKELPEAMLFLKNIRDIKVMEIDAEGKETVLATATIENADAVASHRRGERAKHEAVSHHPITITLQIGTAPRSTRSWMIIHFVEKYKTASGHMARRLNRSQEDVEADMSKEKLLPQVALALPIPRDGATSITNFHGRLFTLLPLPIFTNFPVHINAVLALTSSRQNLRNYVDVEASSHEEFLVEWNRVIFSEFVPKAWVLLLKHLVGQPSTDSSGLPGLTINVYEAWPGLVPTQDGDSGYWSPLPSRLLEEAAQAAVWPFRGPSSRYSTLNNILAAVEETNQAPLSALDACNVPLVIVPERVLRLIEQSELKKLILSPQSLYPYLKKNVDKLSRLDSAARRSICDYLVSAFDMRFLLDLPLIPQVQNTHTSITAQSKHILATESEAEIFGNVDRNLLVESAMSAATRELLVNDTAKRVQLIGPNEVARYLRDKVPASVNTSVPNISTGVTDETFQWLVKFWHWLDEWEKFKKLSGHPAWNTIRNLYALPLHRPQQGRPTLRLVRNFAIRPGSMEPELISALAAIEVPVLDGSTSHGPAIRSVSREHSEVLFILQNIPRNRSFAHVDQGSRQVLFDFFSRQLSNYLRPGLKRQHPPTLNADSRNVLRTLPIFPILSPGPRDDNNVTFDATRGVASFVDDSVTVVPRIQGAPFVSHDRASIFYTALEEREILGEIAVLQKVITDQNWPQQKAVQGLLAALVDRLINRLNEMGGASRARIAELDFVEVGGRAVRKSPSKVVDPTSELAGLYDEEDEVLPVGIFNQEGPDSYIHQLRNYGMLRTTLTPPAVEERIARISDESQSMKDRPKKALLLLKLLDDYTQSPSNVLPTPIVNVLRASAWLPVDGGLRTSFQCWDSRGRDSLLCDLVSSRIPFTIVSPHLRDSLGWDQVPFQTLRSQLRKVLETGTSPSQLSDSDVLDRIEAVLEEIAERSRVGNLSQGQIQSLVQGLGDSAWLPTSSRGRCVARLGMLEQIDLGTVYQSVAPHLLRFPGMEGLLRRMGICDRPTQTSLLSTLQEISTELSKTDTSLSTRDTLVQTSILILAELSRSIQGKESEFQATLIPTEDCQLVPAPEVLFNDMGGDPTCPPTGLQFAHPLVSVSLANAIGLRRLSEEDFSRGGDGIESFHIGEDLTVRIRRVLQDYDIDHSSNEWVANADDARATSVTFLIDEVSFEGRRVIGGLASFQSGPSLVVHNDGVFTDADFKGLGNIGQGGKSGMPDSIGRFGLGALSFYHFSELPWVISGKYCLFLDPSKQYLPREQGNVRRSAALVPLSFCASRYPDQLKPLEGLFGFTAKAEEYKGTLFRFPLRTAKQAAASKLSDKHFSAVDIVNTIDRFYAYASQSLFFTKSLSRITALRRAGGIDSKTTTIWSVTSTREPISHVLEKKIAAIKLSLQLKAPQATTETSELWLVTRTQATKEGFPEQLHRLFSLYRLPIPSFGIAVNLSITGSFQNSRLFATLPLPVSTSLPVHIHATWILAQDRRSIRYDAPDAAGQRPLDTIYNQHILEKVIPLLYIKTLAIVIVHHPKTVQRFWPSKIQDEPSRIVATEFYHQVISTKSPVLLTVQSKPIAPSSSIIHSTAPPTVHKILCQLKVHNYVPTSFIDTSLCQDWGNLRFDSPKEVSNILRENANAVQDLWQNSALPPKDILPVIDYLVKTGESLDGIPLLIRGDRKLVKFRSPKDRRIFASHRAELAGLFGPSTVVGHELPDHAAQNLVKYNVNVGMLDRQGMRDLLALRDDPIAPGDVKLTNVTQQAWHKDLLKFLASPNCPVKVQELADLPLLPAVGGELVVSLNYARTGRVWWQQPYDDPVMTTVLRHLGVTAIDDQPGEMQINDTNALVRILPVFGQLNLSPQEVLSRVSRKDWDAFVQYLKLWMQDRYLARLSAADLKVLNRLPFFYGTQGNNDMSYVSASQVMMLPDSVPLDPLARYLPPGATFAAASPELSAILRWTKNSDKILSFPSLFGRLQLPSQLAPDDDAPFSALLHLIATNHDGYYEGRLIPDGNGVLRRPSELFDPGVPLFSMAFESRQDLFVHRDFRHLTNRLVDLGVQREITSQRLLECIQAVDRDARQGHDVGLRATLIWEEINAAPPPLREIPFDTIRRLRFVPRHTERHPSDSDFDVYARTLPDVVSLDELCAPNREAVAWIPRGRFATSPTAHLTAVYPGIGEPIPDDVVRHFVLLVRQIAPRHPQSSILLGNIRSVYDWMTKNHDGVKELLKRHAKVPLWLNIDSDLDEWTWRAADDLVFNLTFDTGGRFVVREFLLPYRSLLVEVGAHEYRVATPPPAETSEATTPHPEVVRDGWNELREAGELLDICFKVEGQIIPAHRGMLAAVVPHFKAAFTGSFRESMISADDTELPVYRLPDDDAASAFAIQSIVDFVYIGTFSHPTFSSVEEATAALDDLLDLMELSNLWNMVELSKQAVNAIFELQLIRFDNCDDVLARAEACQMKVLIEVCQKTKLLNRWA